MGYSKYRPGHWKTVGKRQLGQSCSICNNPFWLHEEYYVDAHLHCVINQRKAAAAERRRT